LRSECEADGSVRANAVCTNARMTFVIRRDRALAQLALFVGLAVLHTWPLATAPGRLSRLDNADTALNTWIVAWVSHQVATDPAHLFDAPIFHPASHALAFSEHMVVPSLMGAPLIWIGVSPIAVYNVLVIAGFALSGWAMSMVMTRWTGSRHAGLVAGALFAFNAHLLTRLPHLQALHVQFLPLTLLALDLVLDGGGWWSAVALAAAFALQALCSNYTLVLLAFALIASVAVRPDAWLSRARARLVLPKLAVAGALAVLVVGPFLWPYYRMSREQGFARPLDEVSRYSAGALDYLTTGGRLHYAWWSARIFDGRTALFPGAIAVGLAAVALVDGTAWRDRRARMALAFGVMGVAFSFGPALPGYAWLYEHVPLVRGIRGAARWGFLGLTAIAILAGFGVQRLGRRWAGLRWWPATATALLALVTIEALRAPMGFVSAPTIPHVYARLRDEPHVVLAEFPIYRHAVQKNARYLLNAAEHFQPLVNGYSGFIPASWIVNAGVLETFPSDDAIARLRTLGVTYITVHMTAFAAERGADALDAVSRRQELDAVQTDGDVRLYRLRPQ
jgi:hypothetical protein